MYDCCCSLSLYDIQRSDMDFICIPDRLSAVTNKRLHMVELMAKTMFLFRYCTTNPNSNTSQQMLATNADTFH